MLQRAAGKKKCSSEEHIVRISWVSSFYCPQLQIKSSRWTKNNLY
jgi:hypothetical protein